MTKNSGKSTPPWPSTCQGKSNSIWYAMIGDVLFQEMIYKVNRDSLLLVFRFESLGPGHWKGQQRPKFYKNALKGMSIKQNFACIDAPKLFMKLPWSPVVNYSLKWSTVLGKITIWKSRKGQNHTDGGAILSNWKSSREGLKWIMNTFLSKNLLVCQSSSE